MTRTSETVPVLTQYNSRQTRSKFVTTGRTREYTQKHTGGAVPIMNQYDNWFRNGSLFAGGPYGSGLVVKAEVK